MPSSRLENEDFPGRQLVSDNSLYRNLQEGQSVKDTMSLGTQLVLREVNSQRSPDTFSSPILYNGGAYTSVSQFQSYVDTLEIQDRYPAQRDFGTLFLQSIQEQEDTVASYVNWMVKSALFDQAGVSLEDFQQENSELLATRKRVEEERDSKKEALARFQNRLQSTRRGAAVLDFFKAFPGIPVGKNEASAIASAVQKFGVRGTVERMNYFLVERVASPVFQGTRNSRGPRDMAPKESVAANKMDANDKASFVPRQFSEQELKDYGLGFHTSGLLWTKQPRTYTFPIFPDDLVPGAAPILEVMKEGLVEPGDTRRGVVGEVRAGGVVIQQGEENEDDSLESKSEARRRSQRFKRDTKYRGTLGGLKGIATSPGNVVEDRPVLKGVCACDMSEQWKAEVMDTELMSRPFGEQRLLLEPFCGPGKKDTPLPCTAHLRHLFKSWHLLSVEGRHQQADMIDVLSRIYTVTESDPTLKRAILSNQTGHLFRQTLEVVNVRSKNSLGSFKYAPATLSPESMPIPTTETHFPEGLDYLFVENGLDWATDVLTTIFCREAEMYNYHFRRLDSQQSHSNGILDNMWYSLGQQVCRQSPALYLKHVQLRSDGATNLFSCPTPARVLLPRSTIDEYYYRGDTDLLISGSCDGVTDVISFVLGGKPERGVWVLRRSWATVRDWLTTERPANTVDLSQNGEQFAKYIATANNAGADIDFEPISFGNGSVLFTRVGVPVKYSYTATVPQLFFSTGYVKVMNIKDEITENGISIGHLRQLHESMRIPLFETRFHDNAARVCNNFEPAYPVTGLGHVSDALVGRISWQNVLVQEELQELFSQDFNIRDAYLQRWAAKVQALVPKLWTKIESRERQVYGIKSYFKHEEAAGEVATPPSDDEVFIVDEKYQHNDFGIVVKEKKGPLVESKLFDGIVSRGPEESYHSVSPSAQYESFPPPPPPPPVPETGNPPATEIGNKQTVSGLDTIVVNITERYQPSSSLLSNPPVEVFVVESPRSPEVRTGTKRKHKSPLNIDPPRRSTRKRGGGLS